MSARRARSAMVVPLWCIAGAVTLACSGTAGVEQAPAGAASVPSYQSSGIALRTVFTDSAVYSRFCELPKSGQPDYKKCLLKDQGLRQSTAQPPPIVRP